MTRLPADAAIIQAVRDSSRGPLRPRTLAGQLGVVDADYRAFRERVRDLVRAGKLYRVKGGRIAPPDRISLFTGVVGTTRRGDAFVRSADGDEVFVRAGDLESAMDGDRVVVRIESRPRGRKPEGRVIKVLERARTVVVGVFHEARKMGFVVPADSRLGPDIAIPWGDEGAAREGDVVVVRIVAYGSRRHGPTGEVDQVLGRFGDPGVDVLTILYGHGLTPEFPEEVEAEARRVAGDWRNELQAAASDRAAPVREDLRDLTVFTIDPSDAKDHDDALSLRVREDGASEVGIHIADVSHFVPRGGALDREAERRATSVYLVDRVIPMLPHALSSDACSLRPDEDRLAVSVLAVLAPDGAVREHRFARTVIRSRHRLAYEDAQAVLDGARSVDGETDDVLRRLAELARALRRRREARGALDLDLPEARVVLDPDGAPTDIVRVERLEAHRLVEDFMLLANELVARSCSEVALPALYRVHEPPTQEKMTALRDLLGTFGLGLPRGRVSPADLQGVLRQVRGRPEEQLVSTVVLRSLQRARYAPENLGHFGLALEHYAHFTSPIRRYPDLVTHRVVVRALVEGGTVPAAWAEDLSDVAEHTSLREQAAAEAERDSVDLKKVEYMERHLGDTFDGTVSGVTAFGAFVLLDEVFVDGLLHVNALTDDYYEFREGEYALVGTRHGRRFRLGDRVRVQVARVDREERHIDFHLLEGPRRGV
ncbi:MAG: ribonuclease R [Longimicrobiales bacterium]|nr:ribonuclease R [Longimicrobiales bacterium]